ncbi:hypothetical protein FGB62_333g01 [Gracilaria domingensis]|nr:hypothetical protein FGB62_333g01 [Gracilaria domingensis]
MLGNEKEDTGARLASSLTASNSNGEKSAVFVNGQTGGKKPVQAKLLGIEPKVNKNQAEEVNPANGPVQRRGLLSTKAVTALKPIQVKVHRLEEEIVDKEIVGDGIETPTSKEGERFDEVVAYKETLPARSDGKGHKQQAGGITGICIPPSNTAIETEGVYELTQKQGRKNIRTISGDGIEENTSRDVGPKFPDFAGLVDEDFDNVIAVEAEDPRNAEKSSQEDKRLTCSSSSIIDLIEDDINPARNAACAKVVRKLTMSDGSQEDKDIEDVVIPIDLEKFMREQESEIGAMNEDGVVGRAEIFGGRARRVASSTAQKRGGANPRLGRRKRRRQARDYEEDISNVEISPKQLWKNMVQETLGRSPDHFRSKNAMLRDLDIRRLGRCVHVAVQDERAAAHKRFWEFFRLQVDCWPVREFVEGGTSGQMLCELFYPNRFVQHNCEQVQCVENYVPVRRCAHDEPRRTQPDCTGGDVSRNRFQLSERRSEGEHPEAAERGRTYQEPNDCLAQADREGRKCRASAVEWHDRVVLCDGMQTVTKGGSEGNDGNQRSA